MAKKPPRTKNKDNARRSKKKVSVLNAERVDYVDYKDVNLLNRFVSDRSKIRNRRVTGNDVQQQRDVANAVKNAREMALLPYTKRVSQTRAGRPPRDGEERRERGGFRRDDLAPASPSAEVTDGAVLGDDVDVDVDETVEA